MERVLKLMKIVIEKNNKLGSNTQNIAIMVVNESETGRVLQTWGCDQTDSAYDWLNRSHRHITTW